MANIGIVADDLTGATTVGVLLARAGITTAAFFEEKSLNAKSDYEAIVLSSDSRSDEKTLAREKVKSAVLALKEQGVTHFSKRTDTTLRGGIGYEIDAMLEVLDPDTIAVMVPAMPQSNRIVVGGYSIIDGVALSKTAVAGDVKTPVTESFIPKLIAKQTSQKMGHIPLGTILSGKESLKKHLDVKKRNGSKLIICDAITKNDVKLIAEAVTELNWKVLAVDPGPFSEELAVARGFGKTEVEKDFDEVLESEMEGTVLVVSGSATPVTRTQMDLLASKPWTSHVPVSAEQLIDVKRAAPDEINRAIEKTLSLIKQQKPNVVMVETALSGKILDLEKKEKHFNLEPGDSSNNINAGLGKIARGILEDDSLNIKGIYMTGGDTMVNVMKELDAEGIELLDYVIPQADLGRITGGAYNDLVVVGKGGLTGVEDTAIDIIKRIFGEACKEPSKIQLT